MLAIRYRCVILFELRVSVCSAEICAFTIVVRIMDIAKPQDLCEITNGFSKSRYFREQPAAGEIVVRLKVAQFDRFRNVIDRIFCIALV